MDTDVASDHTLLSGAPQWAGVCVWVCVLSQPAASYTLTVGICVLQALLCQAECIVLDFTFFISLVAYAAILLC